MHHASLFAKSVLFDSKERPFGNELHENSNSFHSHLQDARNHGGSNIGADHSCVASDENDSKLSRDLGLLPDHWRGFV
jgi:hypothetical protein